MFNMCVVYSHWLAPKLAFLFRTNIFQSYRHGKWLMTGKQTVRVKNCINCIRENIVNKVEYSSLVFDQSLPLLCFIIISAKYSHSTQAILNEPVYGASSQWSQTFPEGLYFICDGGWWRSRIPVWSLRERSVMTSSTARLVEMIQVPRDWDWVWMAFVFLLQVCQNCPTGQNPRVIGKFGWPSCFSHNYSNFALLDKPHGNQHGNPTFQKFPSSRFFHSRK